MDRLVYLCGSTVLIPYFLPCKNELEKSYGRGKYSEANLPILNGPTHLDEFTFTYCFSSRLNSERECVGNPPMQVRDCVTTKAFYTAREKLYSLAQEMINSSSGDSLDCDKCRLMVVHWKIIHVAPFKSMQKLNIIGKLFLVFRIHSILYITSVFNAMSAGFWMRFSHCWNRRLQFNFISIKV